MTLYRVTWTIDIDAEDHTEAAEKALEIHRDPESIATVFEVTDLSASTLAYRRVLTQQIEANETWREAKKRLLR